MKKIVLLFSFACLTIGVVSAQCTPDPQYTNQGVYPDSATGFDAACVAELYDQLITVVVPADTCVEVFPGFPCQTFDFDSIVIVSFTGLPPGFTYACNDIQNVFSPADQCAFEGATTGCVSLSGTPNPGDEGNYPLVITVDVYIGGQGSPAATEVIDWYYIDVLGAGMCTAGIEDKNISSLSAYPNPSDNILTIDGLTTKTERIIVTDNGGKVVAEVVDISTPSIELNVSNLEPGLYFVRVNSENATEVIRVVKN